VGKENLSDTERNFLILNYLYKDYGKWINRNVIGINATGRTMNRKTLDELLDSFIDDGYVQKRDAKDPKAKFEFKLTEEGKVFCDKCLPLLRDPAFRSVGSFKEGKRFDEI